MKKLLDDLGITPAQLRRMLLNKKQKSHVIKEQIVADTFTFGIVSDTHLCSNHEKLNELHTTYAIFKKEGITQVVHSGDLVAGWGVYPGQENEVHTYGADQQVAYFCEHYPKVEGITTYFITGNHDLSFLKLAGVDIGEMIAARRPDLVYIGRYQGDIVLGKTIVRLFHGEAGGSYALTYKSQKIVEQIPSGKKPHILVCGHWHTAVFYQYRLMSVFHAGAFEGQSLYLVRKGINPTIGGWTCKVRQAKDKKNSIVSVTPTFIPFY